MSTRNFSELRLAREASGLISCVGLDPDPTKIPQLYTDPEQNLYAFLREIVEATHDLAGSYKPNFAFFLKYPNVLRRIISRINAIAPGIPVILDAKWADIGNTNARYVSHGHEFFGTDAITVHAWHGMTAMEPFLRNRHKGVIVVCRTSNPDANEFQMRIDHETGLPMFAYMARRVANQWNHYGNCGIVVAGTCTPEEIALARHMIADDMPILMPGFGSQGGNLELTLRAGFNSTGGGAMPVNASEIIHASSDKGLYTDAARCALQKFNSDISCVRATHVSP